MEKQYLIIPENDDANRGDQALIWETKRIAEESGLKGQYFMYSNPEKSPQSIKKNIIPIKGILLHPSRMFKKNDNIHYTPSLYAKWGTVALFDFVHSFLLLIPFFSDIVLYFSNSRVKEAMKILKSCNVVLVKGGGFIHSHGEITSLYKMYYSLYHIILAKRLGKKVIVMPNSFGPFEGIGVKLLTKTCLKKIDLIFSRETISQKMLKDDLDIDSIFAPDLGFFAQKDYVEIGSFLSKTKKNVALTARPYRFPEHKNSDDLYKRYIYNYAEFVSWLIINNYNPVFVEHVYNNNEHEKDISAINQICNILSERGQKIQIISDKTYNCENLKSIYSQFDYVVGTRFHSVIFSISESIPTIAITYGGNKGIGIMKDIGMSKYSIPIDDFSADSIKKIFIELTKEDFDFKKLKEELDYKRNIIIDNIKKALT